MLLRCKDRGDFRELCHQGHDKTGHLFTSSLQILMALLCLLANKDLDLYYDMQKV